MGPGKHLPLWPMVPGWLQGHLLEVSSLGSWLKEFKSPDWEEFEDILEKGIRQLQASRLSLFKSTLVDEPPLPYIIPMKFANCEQNEEKLRGTAKWYIFG